MKQNSSFDFFQPFKDAKTILSFWGRRLDLTGLDHSLLIPKTEIILRLVQEKGFLLLSCSKKSRELQKESRKSSGLQPTLYQRVSPWGFSAQNFDSLSEGQPATLLHSEPPKINQQTIQHCGTHATKLACTRCYGAQQEVRTTSQVDATGGHRSEESVVGLEWSV